jgi:hypothetical protein
MSIAVRIEESIRCLSSPPQQPRRLLVVAGTPKTPPYSTLEATKSFSLSSGSAIQRPRLSGSLGRLGFAPTYRGLAAVVQTPNCDASSVGSRPAQLVHGGWVIFAGWAQVLEFSTTCSRPAAAHLCRGLRVPRGRGERVRLRARAALLLGEDAFPASGGPV